MGTFFSEAPPSAGEEKSIVVNLSSKVLPPGVEKSLGLGLGFVPTPAYNAFHTRVDLFKLFRNIKLRQFFCPSTTDVVRPFKKKSTFVPNICDPAISVFEKMVLKDVAELEI